MGLDMILTLLTLLVGIGAFVVVGAVLYQKNK